MPRGTLPDQQGAYCTVATGRGRWGAGLSWELPQSDWRHFPVFSDRARSPGWGITDRHCGPFGNSVTNCT